MGLRRRKMKLSSRLALVYTLLVTVFISAAMVIFYQYYSRQIFEEDEDNLVQLSDTVMTQVDNILDTLDQEERSQLLTLLQKVKRRIKERENPLCMNPSAPLSTTAD